MSLPHPLISIIIPCHNYAHTLGDTLKSIQSQTLTDWEAIIVNDGSSDNTQELVERFTHSDERFIGIYQDRRGVSAARNTGMRIAKGSYLLFLDADDLISPKKLEIHKKHFEANAEIDISYSYCQYFHTSEPHKLYPSFDLTHTEWMQKHYDKGSKIAAALVKRNLFVISSPIIKRSTLSKKITFKENMKFYEDWLFWFSCAAENLSFHYCDNEECLTLIRVHDTSTVQDKEKMFGCIPPFRQEIGAILNKLNVAEFPNKKSLKKTNKKLLEKWCRKKLRNAGLSASTLGAMITETNLKTTCTATAKHIAKAPTYFLKTFFRPR
ncbi:MAG: glycosyltransferase family A protein [Halopseudomonas sp.]|uniref:glycosyltransferase family 2 protein n=1 Tax=Halopseudomonas sp. TaxID=2901191 RepID=UPI003002990C